MTPPDTREQLLRGVYDRFVAGDYAGIEPHLHPEVEYVNPEDAVEPGTRRGVAAFLDALERLQQMFHYETVEVRELVERGDDAVAVVHFLVHGKGSAVPIEVEFAHLITWEGNRLRRLEWFRDRASAISALR